MMSSGTSVAEDDWSAPATRGELISVKLDLEREIDGLGSKIDLLDSKVDLVAANLRLELKDLRLGVYLMISFAIGALTVVGILLRFF